MASRMRFSSISPRSLKPLTALAPTLACALGLSLLTVTTASAAPAAPTVTAATAAETSVDLTWSLPTVTATKMAQIGAGYGFECAIEDTTGVAWCVGNQAYGVLGNGSTSGDPTQVFTQVSTSQRFSTVESATQFSCAINTANAAYCWGVQLEGRLGNGEGSGISSTPVAVDGSHAFNRISALDKHTCALTTAGAAYCWGDGDDGKLGYGAFIRKTEPTAVTGGHSFSRVTAGEDHSCGIDTAEDAWCWGKRKFGVLGDGGDIAGSEPDPLQVGGGLKFREIDAGGTNTCALTATGAAYCWGKNDDGQLGNGSTVENSNVPVAVSGGHTFTQITLGDRFACALDGTDTAWCWGKGYKLGNGTTDTLSTDFNVPTQVSGGHKFKTIKANMDKACAIDDSDRVWCWGSGVKGAPDPDGTFHTVPTQLFDPNDPDDYKVETSTDGTTWTTATASTGGTARTYSVTGLTAGTAYYFRVTGSSGGTLGTASAAYGPVSTIGAALTPTFATPTATAGGFTVQVSNYDASYTWTVSSTAGSAAIDGTGLITVTGLTSGQSATVTVNTTRTSYTNGSATTTGTASTGTDGVPTPVPMLPLSGLLGVGLLVAGLGGRRLRQAWRR